MHNDKNPNVYRNNEKLPCKIKWTQKENKPVNEIKKETRKLNYDCLF